MRFETIEEQRNFFMKDVAVYENELRQHLWKLLYDSHVVDDVMQSTMEKAWKHLNQLENQESVKNWLYKIATNETNQYFRRRDKYAKLIWNEGNDPTFLERIPDMEESILERIVTEFEGSIAADALHQLKPEEKSLINMRYLRGMLPREMAGALGLKSGTLSSKLCRAVKKYRQIYLSMEKGDEWNEGKKK